MHSHRRGPVQAATPPSAELLAGRYSIVGEVGRGGCAVVYEARDSRLQRTVAIKVLHVNSDGSTAERFQREARVAAAVHHPNVCAVTDAGWLPDGRPFLVMERLFGETLRQYLGRVGPLHPEETIDIALQILSGLEASHALGIVHRDVKPDNVFLVERIGCAPLVKLLDFGMCRRQTPTHVEKVDDRTLTRAGTVVGTPEYMAPEQVTGRREFDARIDLYAVGVVLYEALTGRRAFAGPDVRSVLASVLMQSLPPLRMIRPDLPTVVDRIVARALERDPRNRYFTAVEFQEDLLAAKAKLVERRERAYAERESGAVLKGYEWEQPTRPVSIRRSN